MSSGNYKKVLKTTKLNNELMLEITYYDNGIKKAKIEELEKIKDKKIWIDTHTLTKEEVQILGKVLDIHETTQEDLFNSNVRIKVEEFDNYLFCIFYGIKKNKGLEFHELDFVIGENFIISNHKKDLESFEKLKKNKEKLEELFKEDVDSVFHELIDEEIDNYFPVLEEIDVHIEKLGEESSKKPKPKILKEILNLKRSIILGKRIVYQQREKMSFLAKKDYKQISKSVLPYIRDVYDNTIRVSDSLDNSRERIANAYDIYMSTMNHKMNEVMKVMSVIATMALPLTVISSIYGTNFAILPGALNPIGFWMMIASMLIISIGSLIFFRKRGWF